MIAEAIALSTGVVAAAAEWTHARRSQRVTRLAFGPAAAPRIWTKIVPTLRVISLILVTWGTLQLYLIAPRASRPQLVPEGGYRHLVIALDVSPSMQLKDSGPQRQQTRAKRASEVMLSMLERVALDQMRVSVVAFYTSAKPAVVDTFDIEVVKNVLNDLPLEYAFTPGKTSLIDGIRESVALAKGWPPGSTTLFVVSDGDTVPDKGLPELPRSISDVLVLGVGNTLSGVNIDGHLSRQDASTLRQLATRLRATYLDVNEKHLPSQQLASLAKAMPMRDASDKGRRELALAAIATGAALMSLLPLALAFVGSSWLPRVPTRPTTSREREGSQATTSGSSHSEPPHSTASRTKSDFARR
jgi:Ca-activated chloride channel family protein